VVLEAHLEEFPWSRAHRCLFIGPFPPNYTTGSRKGTIMISG